MLTAGEQKQTIESIASLQLDNGMIAWFPGGHSDPWNHVEAAMALAIGGTMLAPYVIERMTDHSFRQGTRFVIFAISIVYLLRAAWLYWQG